MVVWWAQKYENTKKQKYKNTKVKKYKNIEMQKYKKPKMQKYKNSNVAATGWGNGGLIGSAASSHLLHTLSTALSRQKYKDMKITKT